MISRVFKLIGKHKRITIISLIVIIIGGYFSYQNLAKNENETQYATVAIEKGALIVSMSGSGQVLVSDQRNIKPKVSGDVVYIGVKEGQEVKTGTLLIQIDTRDAEKSVRDAKISLETAQLELDRLLEPPDELDLLLSENDLAQAKESKQKAKDNLKKAYEDGFNDVSDSFLDFPTIMEGLQSVLFDSDFNLNQANIDYYASAIKMYDNSVVQYKDDAYNSYHAAREKYDQNFQNYKDVSRYSDTGTIENIIKETYETAKYITEAIKDAKNLIDFYRDILIQKGSKIPQVVSIHQSALNGYTGIGNNHISSLLSTRRNIQDYKEAIINNERSIRELELSLLELKAGADGLDVRAKEILIQQREDALLDAEQELADHNVRAPFDGIVAEINARRGESISSGNVAVILITEQKIAEITVNEVDVAKVKVGQKVTIIFDAFEKLSIAGRVTEIDTLGTISQGVVTYDIKIIFDTQDERVKPGMSISAAVITDAKQNVLLVPNSAVRYRGDEQYVDIMDSNDSFGSQKIEIGISNDIMSEVISGLKEGDKVATQKISSDKALLENSMFKAQSSNPMRTMRGITK